MEFSDKLLIGELIGMSVCIAAFYYSIKDIKITVTKHKPKNSKVQS